MPTPTRNPLTPLMALAARKRLAAARHDGIAVRLRTEADAMEAEAVRRARASVHADDLASANALAE